MVVVGSDGGAACVKAKASLSHSKVSDDFLATRSLFRVRTSVLVAAGFFDGGEFHEFDAGFVGVVEIELPFAVAADLGLFGPSPAVLD